MRSLSFDAKYAAKSLLSRPALRGLSAARLAQTLRVPELRAREAIAAVVDLAHRAGRGEPVYDESLTHAIGSAMSLDQAMARYGSNAAAPTYSARPGWARGNAGADDAEDQGGDSAPRGTPIIAEGDNRGAVREPIKEAPRPAPGPGPAPPPPPPPPPPPSVLSRVPWYVWAAGAGAVALVVFGKKKKRKS